MSENLSTFSKIIYNLSIIISAISVIQSLILLTLNIFKWKKLQTKFLIFQFLFTTITNGIYISLLSFHILQNKINCKYLLILRFFSVTPEISITLFISLTSLFILTGNSTYRKKKNLVNTIFTLLIWLPSVFIAIYFLFILKDDSFIYNRLTCIVNYKYQPWLIIISLGLYIIATFTVCGIIIYKLYAYKSNHIKEESDRAIKTMCLYIIGIFLFVIINVFTLLQGGVWNVVLENAMHFFVIGMSLMNVFMVVIFVWNKYYLSVCLSVFCCKVSKEEQQSISELSLTSEEQERKYLDSIMVVKSEE